MKRFIKVLGLMMALVTVLSVLSSCQLSQVFGNGGGSTTKDPSQSNAPEEIVVPKFDYQNANLAEYVTLGTYKGLVVSVKQLNVTDEDVEARIRDLLLSGGYIDKVYTGTAAEGDTINISYAGLVDADYKEDEEAAAVAYDNMTDEQKAAFTPSKYKCLVAGTYGNSSYDADEIMDIGLYNSLTDAEKANFKVSAYKCTTPGNYPAAFNGGTANDVKITLNGSTGFIDGFEEAIVGIEVGVPTPKNITFPEDYSGDLKGKEVVFVFTLNYICQAKVLNNDIVKEITDGEYNTVGEYLDYTRDLLEESLESTNKNAAWSIAVQNATMIKYPEEIIDKEYEKNIQLIQDMVDYYKSMGYTITFEEALSSYGYKSKSQLREQIKLNYKENFVAYSILKAENIELTEAKIDEEIQHYIDLTGKSKTELMSEYGEDYILELIAWRISSRLVYENATLEIADAAGSENAGTESAE